MRVLRQEFEDQAEVDDHLECAGLGPTDFPPEAAVRPSLAR